MFDNRALPDAAEWVTSRDRLALCEAVFEDIPDVMGPKDAKGEPVRAGGACVAIRERKRHGRPMARPNLHRALMRWSKGAG